MSTTTYDPQTLNDSDLANELIAAHHHLTTNQAAFVLSLAEFHARKLWQVFGASSTIAWLGRRLNVARSTAYSYVQTSTTLARFSLISDAFLAGKLTYSQVQLLCKYLTEENEYALLKLALSRTVRELELALAGHPDNEGGKENAEDPPESRLDMWIDKHGNYRIEGSFTPAQGAKLAAAIKLGELASHIDIAELDPERLDSDDELDNLLNEAEAATQAAAAATNVADPGGEGSPQSLDVDSSTTRFGPVGRSNVLSGFFGMLNLARSAKHSAQRAPGAQVHVVVTEDGHAFMPLNPAAPAKSLVNLVNDGQVRGYLLNSAGVTVNMGRKKRLVTRNQETAALVSWLFQCATPGCTHTRFLEFHHIKGWAEGGLTNADNILPLCSACHALVTDGVIRIEEDPTDAHRLMFFFADGSVFVSVNRGLPERVSAPAASVSAAEESSESALAGDWDLDPTINFDEPEDEGAEESRRLDTETEESAPEPGAMPESSEESRRLDTEDGYSPVEAIILELLTGTGS